MWLYERAPEFVLTGIRLEPGNVSAGFLFVCYARYVVSYAFGYTVGCYPLKGTLSDLVSRVRKRARSPRGEMSTARTLDKH